MFLPNDKLQTDTHIAPLFQFRAPFLQRLRRIHFALELSGTMSFNLIKVTIWQYSLMINFSMSRRMLEYTFK
jgi:hypothetical protein